MLIARVVTVFNHCDEKSAIKWDRNLLLGWEVEVIKQKV